MNAMENLCENAKDATRDKLRDKVARIVDPYAWYMHDTAVAPYQRGTGSTGDEGWIYKVTWGMGFRTVEQVEAWLRAGEPLPHEHTFHFHLQLQRSLTKADEILRLMESAKADRP